MKGAENLQAYKYKECTLWIPLLLIDLCSYRRKWDSLPTLASVTFMSLTPRGVEGHCWWSQSAVWVSRHFPLLETLSTSQDTLHFSRHSPLRETLSSSSSSRTPEMSLTLGACPFNELVQSPGGSSPKQASWFPVANWQRPGPWRCSSCLGHVLRALELAEAVPRPFLREEK